MITTEPSPGEKLEKIAFQFCKIATVALLCGRFTLPVAATFASGLYLAAHIQGKRDTRCILRYPLLIAAFWGIVAVAAWVLILNPNLPGTILRSVGLGT
jgi:hypothetical protein